VIENGLPRKPFTVIMKDVGHALNAERPAELAEHYLKFLHRLHGRMENEGRQGQTIVDREAADDGANQQVNSTESYLGHQSRSEERVPADAYGLLQGRSAAPSVHLSGFAQLHSSIRPPPLAHAAVQQEPSRPPSPSIVEVPSASPPAPEPAWHEEFPPSAAGASNRTPCFEQRGATGIPLQSPSNSPPFPPEPSWHEDKIASTDDWIDDRQKSDVRTETKTTTQTKEVDRSRKHDSALRMDEDVLNRV
jgi:hypothetical protein